jgi:hypothetical protein
MLPDFCAIFVSAQGGPDPLDADAGTLRAAGGAAGGDAVPAAQAVACLAAAWAATGDATVRARAGDVAAAMSSVLPHSRHAAEAVAAAGAPYHLCGVALALAGSFYASCGRGGAWRRQSGGETPCSQAFDGGQELGGAGQTAA